MEQDFKEMVYNTLCGQLEEEFCVPGVENLYEEGKPCMNWYSEMLDAYGRLRERLGVKNEDKDVETMIRCFLSICEEEAYHMYHYGAKFGDR